MFTRKGIVKAYWVILLCWVFWGVLHTCALARVACGERSNLVFDGVPEIPERMINRLDPYQNIRSASLQDWLPSGQGIFITTRFGETSQVHIVEQPGGARQQLTFFDDPVQTVSVSPNPTVNGFLLTKDVGGSEFFQIFFFDLATGTTRMLTDGQSRNNWGLWSNQGDRFVFSTTQRNGRDWDLHVVDINNPDRTEPVLEVGGSWIALDWSPDDTQLLVQRTMSVHKSSLYILDIETKTLTRFNPTQKPVAYGGARYAKDGTGIYFTSNQDSEFLHLRYFEFETGEIRVLTDHIPWNVERVQKEGGFTLSRDGTYLAFTVNAAGVSQLHILETRSMQAIPLPQLPIGRVSNLRFSPDGTQIGFVLNTPQTPSDVYTIHLSSQELVRWTSSEVGGLKSADFVVPELIQYKTFDEVNGQPRLIPAFYYKPKGDGPFPVLIRIHGGPESQARPVFSPTIQYSVNELGLAVVAPNVRGSRGYGKSYLRLDNGVNREDAVRDIGGLLDWIEAQPELDSSRVAVSGGSYGGYMALASLIHFGDRLRAAIEVVGISNFVTFLENTQDYRRSLRRVEYGDERDPEMRAFLTQISPTTHAANIRTPLFVVQGLNDPRVPVGESEQIVEIIRKNNGTVWYLLATDEGHGFRKKTNRKCFENATVLFWERFLLDRKDAPHPTDTHLLSSSR